MKLVLKFSQEDLEKKVNSYQNPELFKEEEVMVWHDIAGFLGDLQYSFYFLNGSIDQSVQESMRNLTKKRSNFQGLFNEKNSNSDRKEIIQEYAVAIRDFKTAVLKSLDNIKDPNAVKAIQSAASTIFSMWNGYLGIEDVFDLNQQLRDSHETIRRKLKIKNIKYSLLFPKESLYTRTDYFVVISNLVGNALKYAFNGQEDKRISVQGHHSKKNHDFVVSVVDNGYGIHQDNRPYIFNKYFSHNSLNRGHGLGLGLGLYICKKIVEENGGIIQVKSKTGEGSKFSFTIPPHKIIKNKANQRKF